MNNAGGILIRGRKLLVVRGKGRPFFIAPGGGIEENESPVIALMRELKEELNIEVAKENVIKYGSFSAEAVNHPGKIVSMEAFIVQSWVGEPTPSTEIEELRWITTSDADNMKLGSIFSQFIIPRLRVEDLID